MKAIKKPIPIEIVEFQPRLPDTLPRHVTWRDTPTINCYEVFNKLHNSWLEIRPGDYLNVTDKTGSDIYPIDRATFERTYDIVND